MARSIKEYQMSLRIAQVRGIPIRLHFTLVIVFFLVSWTLATGFMPQLYPGLTTTQYWVMGVAGAVLLFVSVLLHELSHSLVAIRFGIKVRQIILFIFGGVSDIEEEPKDFAREFKIAFAGPAMSFILSGIFAVLWWAVVSYSSTGIAAADPLLAATAKVAEGILFYGAILNAMLGTFNLLPAFPMDGGRVLRALLVRRNRDFDQATRISVKVGIAISYVFFGVGFLIMISGSFIAGIWILLIGWFLQSGAQSYLQQHDIMAMLSKVRLEEIMNTRVIAVHEDATVDELVEDYFRAYMKSAFPVTSPDGKLAGMVALRAALAVPEPRRSDIRVRDIMVPKEDLVIMESSAGADEALTQMARRQVGKIFVCDDEGRLAGIVSKTDILEAASDRQEFMEASRQVSR